MSTAPYARPALSRPVAPAQPTTVWGGGADLAAARERLRLTLQQNGAWQGNTPGQPTTGVWRPRPGTLPSPGLDNGAPTLLNRPALTHRPSTALVRPPSATLPSAGSGQAAPLPYASVRPVPAAGASHVRPLASGLPTHTGGVHYGSTGSGSPAAGGPYVPSPYAGGGPTLGGHHHGGHAPVRPYPAWGFAPQPWPMQPSYPVINIFGYGDPSGHCCCPPAWPEPAPVVVVSEPTYIPAPYPVPVEVPVPSTTAWPEPAPATLEPSYPTPAFPEPTAEPAPSSTPAPDPVEPAAPELTDAAREAAFRVAFEAFRRGEFEDALTGFLALTQSDPKFGEAWMAVAHAALALGRYDVSAQAVTQSASLGGFPRGYRFDPAPLYADPQGFAGFLAALERQVAQRPEDADARLTLAWLYVSLGRRALAQDQIQQVLTLRPADAAAPVLALALLPAAPAEQAPATSNPPVAR